MTYFDSYLSPIGRLVIFASDDAIVRIDFDKEQVPFEVQKKATSLIQRCQLELEEYFSGKRKTFTLPIQSSENAFYQACYDALLAIPYGQTRSYKDIAIAINRPRAYRAVGMANNRNPIPIIVPCHRVIGSSGKLVGYAGGLNLKQFLLALEAS